MAEAIVLMFMLGGLAFAVILLVAHWVIYRKAGKPGWASRIPIYNALVLLEIVGRPWWWLLLFLLPGILMFAHPVLGMFALAAIVVMSLVLYHDLAVSFGKGWGWALGLIFLGFVFFPMLAFGDATYKGPAAKAA